MIEYKVGNIFDGNEEMICHQVNTFGVMEAGIAAQIKDRFPLVYEKYRNECENHSNHNLNPLGNVLICNHYMFPRIVNMFSQRGMETDYSAMLRCFNTIKSIAENNNWSVAIPYKIGCGVAKGNWNTIELIIKSIFEDSDVKCVIYKLEDDI